MVVELLSHVLSGCPKLEPLTVIFDDTILVGLVLDTVMFMTASL